MAVDDKSVRRALKRLLHCAIEAETFPDGEAFLDALSSAAWFQPACAIEDFQMPGINGRELQGPIGADWRARHYRE
ncbi:hypothetical protein LJ656_34370 [Paraburkholderia sp. MMS20-SJTR3]|uniref:Response regulatory domain-containing protein n=1 Tax=Paraburkholderia sejongensis TaxID=2886946 RepID=A0ABS8K636_9BURK|nr:hypothetical protein [Paraburkholderia sp. MMS20-SJTR3]MCC8397631.1 hypothetical protein [Paraburkholderia sp. MMS20-SJTR3]